MKYLVALLFFERKIKKCFIKYLHNKYEYKIILTCSYYFQSYLN